MARQVALLRGINLGSRNRISMPELRSALADAGYDDVRTYVQSGNVVLTSTAKPDRLERELAALIAERFGLDVPVVVRTRNELAKVVQRNPLAAIAVDPKRYQVTFLRARPPRELTNRLEAAAAPSEAFVVDGREVYAWHPAGVARSKLWTLLAGTTLGIVATSRNWTTVTTLLA